MFELGSFAHLLEIFDQVTRAIADAVNRARGQKRRMLLELQSNIELIYSYGRYDLPIDEVILGLETDAMRDALESGYRFQALQRAEVSHETAGKEPQYQQYVGWSTEQLFSNIYVKVKDLRRIVQMDPSNKQIRKRVRLINVLKMMALVVKHVHA